MIVLTAYQLSHDDGTVERFVVESFNLAGVVKVNHYECKTADWYRVHLLGTMLLKGTRVPEEKHVLYHSKLRRKLRQTYGAKLTFDNQTTNFNETMEDKK